MCWLAPEPEETYGLLDPVVRSRRGSGVDPAEPPGAHECHRRRYENRTPAGPPPACPPRPPNALLERARQDPQVRCVILTGAGERAFCAGADIKERAGQALPQPEYHLQQKATLALFREMEQFEKPLIAAINGVAMGGGLEIALCCDVRIAARGARLGLPEAKIGALPAAGGTQRLPRLVGPGIAKELMLTGDAIGAERGLAIGLINQVVEPEALLPTALAVGSRMAANAPLALRHIKHAVDQGMQVGIDAGLEYERYAAALVVSSEDRLEG